MSIKQYKSLLENCKHLIIELQDENQKLRQQVKMKNQIIDKLVKEKQKVQDEEIEVIVREQEVKRKNKIIEDYQKIIELQDQQIKQLKIDRVDKGKKNLEEEPPKRIKKNGSIQHLKTPETIKSIPSTNIPLSEPAYSQQLPRNLFSNSMLQPQSIVKRVKQLLADSDTD